MFERVGTPYDLYAEGADGLLVHLGVTGEHPFWVGGRGWVEVQDIQPEDRVWSLERGWLWVRSVHERPEQEPVYNLRVAEHRTYFVGDSAIWVHNAACSKGTRGGKKAPVHHIMTNKNRISTVRGGPWTPRFEDMAKRAGMTLEDAANKVAVPGHRGPHPKAYHEAVFNRLHTATQGMEGDAYSSAFRAELDAIRAEATTAGSALNKMLTK